MSRLLDALRTILLDDPSSIEALPPADAWRIAALLEANRLEPVVYRKAEDLGAEAKISLERMTAWRLAHVLSVGRTIAFAESLREIVAIAGSLRAPVRLLRGTQLAFFVHQSPQERPLDDLEIQTLPESALRLHLELKGRRFLELDDVGVEDPVPEEGPVMPRLARDGVTVRIWRRSCRSVENAPWDPFSDPEVAPSRPRILRPEPLILLLAEDLANRQFRHALRTVFDLHIVRLRLRPSWPDLVDLAARAGLVVEAYLALEVAGTVLGRDGEDGPCPELRARCGDQRPRLDLLRKMCLNSAILHAVPWRLSRHIQELLADARTAAAPAAAER